MEQETRKKFRDALKGKKGANAISSVIKGHRLKEEENLLVALANKGV